MTTVTPRWPVLVAILLCATTLTQASQLLDTISDTVSGQSAPFEAPTGLQVQLEYLTLESIGQGFFWTDGSSGVVDLNVSNTPSFLAMTDRLSNGMDETLLISAYNASGSGGGGGGLESSWGLGSPDLVGNQIDFIRLVVHDFSIQPYNPGPPFGDGLMWNANVTWEFWGTPVPEPATLASLFLVAILRRLRRRS